MSATRPATEFSIGIIARAARPSSTAANASSKAAQGRLVQCFLAGEIAHQAPGEGVARAGGIENRLERIGRNGKILVLREHRGAVFTSFVAFSLSHNVGLATLSAVAVRLRLYVSVNIPPTRIALMSVFCAFTTALGSTALIAYSLLTQTAEASRLMNAVSLSELVPPEPA